jgi:hypothetical protein
MRFLRWREVDPGARAAPKNDAFTHSHARHTELMMRTASDERGVSGVNACEASFLESEG